MITRELRSDWLRRRIARFAILRDTAPKEDARSLWQLRIDGIESELAQLARLAPGEVLHEGVVLQKEQAARIVERPQPAVYAVRALPNGELSVRAVRPDWKLDADEFSVPHVDVETMELDPEVRSGGLRTVETSS